MYHIGTLAFKTKKAAMDFTRAKIHTTGTGPTTDPFFFDLLKNHATDHAHTPTTFQIFSVLNGLAMSFDHDQVFSWRTCCEFRPRTPLFYSNRAMRQSIRPQIQAFRHANADVCSKCSTREGDLNYEVDHVVPFKTLAEGYIALHPAPTDCLDDHSFMDKDYERGWTEFHQQQATLQMLCKPCNQAKGAT